jgi:hypothetical protein
LQPVGGATPYLVKQAPFTAAGTEGVLQFQGTTASGDHTILIDNVVVLPANAAPFFLSQPASAVSSTGNTVTFRAAAVGGGTLTYQWKKDGQILTNQTTDTLTLDSLTFDMAGNYTVEVKNSAGTTASAAAKLAVLESIPGVFNTGVDTNGIVLDDGGTDPHYVLVQNVDNPQSQASFVIDSTVFPISTGTWLADTDASKWIGPRVDPAAPAGGDYDYRMLLDLTGFDPATVVLSGNLAVDNSAQVWVNGVDTGASGGGFGAYSVFSITGVFKPRTNQVDFKVNNGDAKGPTGLRVDSLAAIGLKGGGVALPTITISRSGQNLRVAWPASSGFRLQKTAKLPGGWVDSTVSAQVAGNEMFIAEGIGGSAAFYRLAK